MSTIDDIIRRESSEYTNHPNDRGGPTKYGVTIPALQEYRSHPVTANDIKALTEREARDLYENMYVRKPRFNMILDAPLRDLLIDSGVLHGRGRATRWLQAAVGAKQDGILGTQTLAALNSQPAAKVYRDVLRARVISIGAFISADHSQAVFAEGWNTRVAEFI